jgi:DNA-binding MarR family transcriptional regulator
MSDALCEGPQLHHSAIYSIDIDPAEMKSSSPQLTKRNFESLSEFRHQLRRFIRFSEEAAKAEGLQPQQYQLLLHVKGHPGRDWATIGELAERLQVQHHAAVTLVSRCETARLVRRSSSKTDQRVVEVRLTRRGERFLQKLARLHLMELHAISHVFAVANITAFNDRDLGSSAADR